MFYRSGSIKTMMPATIMAFKIYVDTCTTLHLPTKMQNEYEFSTKEYNKYYMKNNIYTVEPLYNEVLGTMKITLLYQGKKTKKYKQLGPAK